MITLLRRLCDWNSVIPYSSPGLTTSWLTVYLCQLLSVSILAWTCNLANWTASYQLGSLICWVHLSSKFHYGLNFRHRGRGHGSAHQNLTFSHVLRVMQCFHTKFLKVVNLEYLSFKFVNLVSSVLFMAVFGELMIRCCFAQSKEPRVSPQKNLVT